MDLQGRAAIVGGGSRSVSEIPAQKCSGACGIGLAALEILARGREAVDRTRGGQEGYPVTEFLGPGIPREACVACRIVLGRSDEHTSDLQSLMRISNAVLCLKNKNKHKHTD